MTPSDYHLLIIGLHPILWLVSTLKRLCTYISIRIINHNGICAKDSNSMKSSNPNSGIYEAETSRTLDGNGGNPACNQGGIAVVEEHTNDKEVYAVDQGGGKSACNVSKNQAPTLTCTHGGEPAVYCMTTGSYTDVEKEKSPTLMARDYKDPNVINAPSYRVGRDAFNQGTNAKFNTKRKVD